MRVFHRCIHTGGCQCEPPVTHSDSKCVTCAMPPTFQCGGVGEVCVLPSHRRRGLATDLLRMAIDYMAACGMDVSSLHAAKFVQPMYVQRLCRGVCACTLDCSERSCEQVCASRMAVGDVRLLHPSNSCSANHFCVCV